MVWRKFDPRDVSTYPNSDGYNIYLVWMGGVLRDLYVGQTGPFLV